MVDIQAFRNWQLEGNRTVKIEMGSINEKETFRVWVYDYDLSIGQLVKTVEDINLEERRKQQLEQVIKELSAISKNEPVLKGESIE